MMTEDYNRSEGIRVQLRRIANILEEALSALPDALEWPEERWTIVNGDLKNRHQGGKIATPQPDFDKLSYWAGMAMRSLLSPADVDNQKRMAVVAKASWIMTELMLSEYAEHRP